VQDRLGQPHPLPEALGERSNGTGEILLQLGGPDRLREQRLAPLRSQTAEVRHHAEILLNQHLGVEGRLLGQVADVLLRSQGIALDVYATDANRPGTGLEEARQHADQGRLARSIGTEQADDLPSTDAKRDVGKRDEISVLLADRLNLDHSLFVS